MARVLYAAPIIEIDGTIGGTTFRHTWCGNLASAYTIPIDRKTPAQLAVRAAFSHAAGWWKVYLDDFDRLCWDIEAYGYPVTNDKGEPGYLGAYQYYLHINIPRSLDGLDPLKRPPGYENI